MECARLNANKHTHTEREKEKEKKKRLKHFTLLIRSKKKKKKLDPLPRNLSPRNTPFPNVYTYIHTYILSRS